MFISFDFDFGFCVFISFGFDLLKYYVFSLEAPVGPEAFPYTAPLPLGPSYIAELAY